MEYDTILKHLLYSRLTNPDKYVKLASYYLAGFLAHDEFYRIIAELGITQFEEDEMEYIAQMDATLLEPLRYQVAPTNPGFLGILDTGRRKYIHGVEELKEQTISNTYKQIWHQKHIPDNSKINNPIPNPGTDNYITFLEEYGFVHIPELEVIISRTAQPVIIGGEMPISPPAVFIFPEQTEMDMSRNVPQMRAFGGGLGLYGAFRGVNLSNKFRRKYGCPANIAFVCTGYCSSFETPSIAKRVDGYLLEWMIN